MKGKAMARAFGLLVVVLAGCGGVDGTPYVMPVRQVTPSNGDADAPDTDDGASAGADSGVAPTGTLYVAIDGDDAASGTIDAPLATIDAALSRLRPGGTVVVRGGTYNLASAVRLEASGDGASARLALVAQAGELVTLDFATNPRHADPPRPRVDDALMSTGDAVGLLVTGDWWHVEGFRVRNAAYYGVRVYGSHNVFARLDLAGNKASGLEITGKDAYAPADNLVVDCDSHDNFDPQGNGEDADGFAAKFDTLGPDNVFLRTRSWGNSDDGYDFWHAAHRVLIEECWSFENGFSRPEWAAQISGAFQGDGFGFKLGQDAADLALVRVVAWGNKGFGIDDNGNRGPGLRIANATLFANAKSGNVIQVSLDDGMPHVIVNSLIFDTDAGFTQTAGVQLTGAVVDDGNSWTASGVSVTLDDFLDADLAHLRAAATTARAADGTRTPIGLRLRPGSDLVDAGLAAGGAFVGAAPDLGAFELGAP